ncbi:hypothetical protein ACJMK2_016814 [Sinanodonta woodiana]|uniref:Uncharacterized protein n=1 Tax=Sinanodonta woodiana TaxID=1069815 RepID=A0ABD3UUX6_SINWO
MDSAVSENAKVDSKFMVQKAFSKICAKSENKVRSGSVIGEISKNESLYEDLSPDATQTKTYDVFKHAIVTEGCLGIPRNDFTDPIHLNEDLYDRLRDSHVSHAYWVLENQNIENSQPIPKAEKHTTYETVEIGNVTSGFPIYTTKFQPTNGSSQEMSVSIDNSAEEIKSHEYFILEAQTDARSTDTVMDLCSRKETAQHLNRERYSLDSQNEVENSMTGQTEFESHGSNCNIYHVIEIRNNDKAETVSSSEREQCINMNKQAVQNPLYIDFCIHQSTENVPDEAKQTSRERFTPHELAIEQVNHEYFVLEPHDRQ